MNNETSKLQIKTFDSSSPGSARNPNSPKTGVVDAGGGLRGVYAAGVLDFCVDNGIRFDLGIGISAGSTNLASYAAGQRGRNYHFYTEYSFRKEYMGMRDLIKTVRT